MKEKLSKFWARFKPTEEEKKYAKIGRILYFVLVGGILISLPFSSKATSYPSWMRAGEANTYANLSETGKEAELPDTFNESTPAKELGKIFTDIGFKLQAFNNTSPGVFSINIDGTVLGILAGYAVSAVKFELFRNNPYGIVSAYAYVVLRNIILALMLIVFVINIIKRAFSTASAKDMVETKEMIKSSLLVFFLIYFMPGVVNWFICLRDNCILLFSAILKGTATSSISIMDTVVEAQGAMRDGSLGGIILYVAMLCGGLFVAAGYMGIALLCVLYFAAFPVVALLSLNNKRIINQWAGAFFTNLAIPFIDYVLLSCVIIMNMIIAGVGPLSTTEQFSLVILWLVAIWGFMPARNIFIRLFGGMSPASSAGAMAFMAMQGLRAAGGALRRGGSSGSAGSIADNPHKEEIANHEKNSDLFGQATSDNFTKLDDLNKANEFESPRVSTLDSELENEFNKGVETQEGVPVPEGAKTADEVLEKEGEPGSQHMLTNETSEIEKDEGEIEADSELGSGDLGNPENKTEEIKADSEADSDIDSTGGDINDMGSPDPGDISMEQWEEKRLANLEATDGLERTINGDSKEYADLNAARENYESYASVQEQYDANNGQIRELRASNESLNAQKDVIEQQFNSGEISADVASERIGNIQKGIDYNNSRMSEISADNADLMSKMTPEWRSDFDKAKLEYKQAQVKYDTSIHDAKTELAQRRDIERSFATQDRLNGGSGVTYSDASSYRQVVRDNNLKRSQIDYTNYNSKEYAGLLTPNQRHEYAKSARRMEVASSVAKGVVGTAAAVGLGAGMAMGGPAATMAGVTGGMMLGEKAKQKAYAAPHNLNQSLKYMDARGYEMRVKFGNGVEKGVNKVTGKVENVVKALKNKSFEDDKKPVKAGSEATSKAKVGTTAESSVEQNKQAFRKQAESVKKDYD